MAIRKRQTLDWLAAAELNATDCDQPGLCWVHVMINNPLIRQKTRADLRFCPCFSRLPARTFNWLRYRMNQLPVDAHDYVVLHSQNPMIRSQQTLRCSFDTISQQTY